MRASICSIASRQHGMGAATARRSRATARLNQAARFRTDKRPTRRGDETARVPPLKSGYLRHLFVYDVDPRPSMLVHAQVPQFFFPRPADARTARAAIRAGTIDAWSRDGSRATFTTVPYRPCSRPPNRFHLALILQEKAAGCDRGRSVASTLLFSSSYRDIIYLRDVAAPAEGSIGRQSTKSCWLALKRGRRDRTAGGIVGEGRAHSRDEARKAGTHPRGRFA